MILVRKMTLWKVISNKWIKKDQKNMLARLTEEMRDAAKQLDFEQAATLRDTIIELKGEMS